MTNFLITCNFSSITKLQVPDETPEDARGEEALLYSSLSEDQRNVFSEMQFNLAKIHNEKEVDRKSKDHLEIDVTDKDKEQRKHIHTVLKRFSKIDSNTAEKEGRKVIQVKHKKEGKGFRHWPRDRPRFLHFTLFKQNCETFEAIGGIAQKTRVDPKHFSYAGTKDRRGRTLQRVSVSMTSAKQVLGSAVGNWKYEVGNFCYSKEDIRLGDLKGNRFELAIRNLTSPQEALEPVMKFFKENGFINYFGTQRFGTSVGVPTSSVGKALLASKFSEAIDLILKPREHERLHSLREARQIWADTKNPHKALHALKQGGKDRVLEGRLLYGLTKNHKNNLLGALEEVPPHQRSMYCHAFQSLLWNRVVSRRIKQYGMQVLKGDLVYKKDVPQPAEGEATSKEDLVEEVVEPKDWNIHDILIPIPGCKVKWPKNETREMFSEELVKEGMDWDCFESGVKSYNMPGDYRHLVVKATDVEWSVKSYSDTTADLLPSPLHLQEKEVQEAEKEQPEDGPVYSALLLSLSLPSSCYATMALRELLRVQTDRASLASQNDYKRSAAEAGAGEVEGEPPAKISKSE